MTWEREEEEESQGESNYVNDSAGVSLMGGWSEHLELQSNWSVGGKGLQTPTLINNSWLLELTLDTRTKERVQEPVNVGWMTPSFQ